MSRRSSYLTQAQRSWIRDWWSAMQPAGEDGRKYSSPNQALGRADRARCRRCASLSELEQEKAPNLLAAYLTDATTGSEPWLQSWLRDHYDALFLVAGVLAHVRTDARDGRSLVAALGYGAPGSDGNPRMSERRFKRLMSMATTEDFYHEVRRAVQLCDGAADVALLAEDLVAWSWERQQRSTTSQPDQNMKYRWARDYYLTTKENNGAQEKTQHAAQQEN